MAHEPIKDLDEYFEIIWNQHKDWKIIQHDEHGGKHDCTDHSYLLRYIPNGELYMAEHSTSYNDGIQNRYMDFPMQLDRAEIVAEKVNYIWKEKK